MTSRPYFWTNWCRNWLIWQTSERTKIYSLSICIRGFIIIQWLGWICACRDPYWQLVATKTVRLGYGIIKVMGVSCWECFIFDLRRVRISHSSHFHSIHVAITWQLAAKTNSGSSMFSTISFVLIDKFLWKVRILSNFQKEATISPRQVQSERNRLSRWSISSTQ